MRPTRTFLQKAQPASRRLLAGLCVYMRMYRVFKGYRGYLLHKPKVRVWILRLGPDPCVKT